jgi:serine phosphatase RsbU (regulator of sigma subunit)
VDVKDDEQLADPSFDRYARLVRHTLQVPVALVSIVEAERQVLPGAVGLPEAYQWARQTPLSHSFCQYVVADGAALVVPDARKDPRLRDNRAIEDLDVVAFAGWPVCDHNGRVIGSLCAIDSEPRTWTDQEMALLADLASSCSAEIAQRELRRIADEGIDYATHLVWRANVLLELSHALTATRTVTDVATVLEQVTREHLGCHHAAMWLHSAAATLDATGQLRGGGNRRADRLLLCEGDHGWPRARQFADLPADSTTPLGDVFQARRPLFFRGPDEQNRAYPAVATTRETGVARAIVPLGADDGVFGVLALLWPEERAFSDDDRVTISALTAYTASAVQRALLLQERVDTALILQSALLTTLPVVAGLDLAGRYRPAAAREQVGGDWYDALVMADGATALVIGDVVGHDMKAAADMGQLRTALRTHLHAGDGSPSATVEQLDRSLEPLGIDALATLVVALVQGNRVRWTNAGHPPPLLIDARGDVRWLETEISPLVGLAPDLERPEGEVEIAAGSTLLFFTDGLVERRGEDIDDGLARLARFAGTRRDLTAARLVDALLDDMLVGELKDDVALLAVRRD